MATPSPSHAWGPNGHRIVAQIAENHLSDAARLGVAGLLGAGESLAEAATWPDDVRSDPAWDRAVTWHYVSIDDGETYETTEKNPDGDVLEALGRFDAALRSPETPREEKLVALRFLVHLVGDVHQPLHVGRRADRGGNEIRVVWFGDPSNLHSVWDGGIIESRKLSFSEFTRFLDHPTAAEVRLWQSTGYREWAQESFDLRGEVYDFTTAAPGGAAGAPPRLGYDYVYSKLPIVERRLLQAGVRLAGVLESIFAPARE